MSIVTLLIACLLIYVGALLASYFKWSYTSLMAPINWFLGLFREEEETVVDISTTPTKTTTKYNEHE